MTQFNPEPPRGGPRELNLQQMAGQFMAGLQRHFDMLAFNLASRECGSESRYNELVLQAGLLPVPQLHQNFEQMQAHARDLLTRQVISDSLNLTMTVLNNCHLFLAVIKAQKEHGALQPQHQQEVQTAQNAFVQKGLNDKFDALESEYKVMNELEDSITSLAFCLQALMQGNGVVTSAQTDGGDALDIELKCAPDGIGGHPALTPIIAQQRTLSFRIDEKIVLQDKDLQDVLLTIGVFAQLMFTSVAKYAQDAAAG